MKNNIHEKAYVIFGLLILASLAISLISWQESSKSMMRLTQEMATKNKVEAQQKNVIVELNRSVKQLNETIEENCL